jgi:outer membrane receptor protein involved in Fe transport
LELSPYADRCANTNLAAAFWLADTYQGRVDNPDTTERDVHHWSWYGSTDLDLTDKLSARLEARFTREKNEVTGLVQNPCIDPNLVPGDPGCPSGPGASRTEIGAGGQPTGPSAVIICGQVGSCDRVGDPSQSAFYNAALADGAQSWWPWGFRPMPGNKTSIDKVDRFWAPKATVEYFWNEDFMTYFSWSRGIKPGGFSLLTSGAFGLDANLDGNYDEIDFDEERLDVWEIGYKSTLADGRVRVNGSFFYQDFKDKQVTVQAVVADTVGTKVENISGSEIYGVELEGTVQITDNLRAGGGWTYLHSEYTDYNIVTKSANDIARIELGNGQGCQRLAGPGDAGLDGCVASFNGNQLERVPEHALIANLNYTNNLLDTGYEWYTEANWRYQDSRYVEAFNIVEFPSYNITDLRAGILGDVWDLTFFLDNVFDDDTIKTGGSNPGIATGSFGFGLGPADGGGAPGINAGPKLPSDTYAQLPNPRIAGVRVSLRFGE